MITSKYINCNKLIGEEFYATRILYEKGFLVEIDKDEKSIRIINNTLRKANNELLLIIHTTKKCNFRCKYCALDFYNDNLKKTVEGGIINFIEKNIKNFNCVCLSWFGGEPLINIDSIEIISKNVIKLCYIHKIPYKSSITTNGYLLTKNVLEKLIASRVFTYIITIDGIREIHNKFRVLENGDETFDRIIDNLKYIRDNIIDRRINIIIRTNFTKESFQYIEEYYNFFDKEFGIDKRFSLFARIAGDWGGERVREIKDSLLGENEYNILLDKISQMNGKIKFKTNCEEIDSGGYCNANYINKYTIGVDGTISKCDSSSQELSIGVLDENGNMNIDWNKYAKWFNTSKYKDEKCDNCFYSIRCGFCSCPKVIALYNHRSCVLEEVDLKELINLYAKNHDIYSLDSQIYIGGNYDRL